MADRGGRAAGGVRLRPRGYRQGSAGEEASHSRLSDEYKVIITLVFQVSIFWRGCGGADIYSATKFA
jgi:hypothetical protein